MTDLHPEADAFVRGILANPADRVRRLVFADWLEERCEPSATAWAEYLRLQAERETIPADHPRLPELRKRAAACRPAIRARLRLPLRAVRHGFLPLLRLLPPANLCIQFADAVIPWALLELIPECIARENEVLPVELVGRILAVAVPSPPPAQLVAKLRFILNQEVVCFSAEANDFREAIDFFYRRREVEFVDSWHYELPLIELESRDLQNLFLPLFEGRFNAFSVRLDGCGVLVHLYDHNRRVILDPFNRASYDLLLDHLLSLPPESEKLEDGRVFRRVNLPRRTGRPCPLDFQYVEGQHPIRSFRVDFL